MKKWISILMCLCMLVQNAPVMAFAATTDNLCDHHPKHTEDCGYVEAVAGSACTHKHSEACYEIVDCKHTCSDECDDPCTTHTCTVDDGCITMERDCHHVHGECGYAEAVEPQDCTTCQPVLVHAENCGYVVPVAEETCDCVPGEDGTVTHIEGCGYVAPVEEEKCDCEPTVTHGGEGCTYVEGKDGSPCTHVCAVVVDSDDSCYKLLCSHKDGGHDDACGYAAAVEGHECHYECSACEDNAGDDSPVPEGVCAHGNSEENCETCVAEIQVMINALPDMEDIGDHNRANVISQLEAIDDRMWKLSDAAKGKLNADKYVDAAFVLSAPEDFFGFVLTKRYEAGASAMPQASFAFLDASGAAATVITPEEQQTTSVEPVSNGGAVRGYLPVGEYTLDETVVGDWNLTMSVNGQADDGHTFTGEGGRAYRIETINTKRIRIQLTPSENGSVKVETNDDVLNENGKYSVEPGTTVTLTVTPAPGYELGVLEVKPESADEAIVPTGIGNTYTFVAPDYNVTVTATFCSHTTESAENKATCKKQAVCDLCGESYGEVNKNNHDETMPSEEYDNGFCSYCDAYQSATQNAEGYYEISNAGQLYWFAEQVNFKNPSINGKLMEDILVNENVLNSDGTVSSGPFRQWYSIGSTEYGVEFKYSGTFNGNGKTISGLYFNYNDKDGVGLFGYVDSGEIQNVGIKDSYFNGGDNVGSVVAHNHKGTVTGCYNTGTVSGANNVGGVVGKNDEGTVTDCYNSGLIGSRVNNVGGVLGGNIGTVSDCYNTGSISGQNCVGGVAGYSNGSATDCYNTGKVDGNEMVGGVLGLNESGSTLSNCYNTGEVNGQFWVGGVLGLNHVGSTLINCYNTGEVGDGFYIGGVLGLNERESTLINCYNTGKVSGGLSDGGVAGKNVQGTIDYCYYLTGSATRGIGEGNGTTEDKTAEAFASGEVAALLGVPFGQNIDNDQTKQEIPCFSNAIVYAVQNCNSDMVYSNTDEDIGHKWNNGVCSICGTPCPHNTFDDTNGKCSKCKTDLAVAMVEIGDTTTYYETLDAAITAAESCVAADNAVVTLLKDIDLGESDQQIDSGVFTLDLNGCTLEGSGSCVLYISGTETSKPDVTITDSSEAGNGTISGTGTDTDGVYVNSSTMTISGGTISATGKSSCGVDAYSNSNVTISGGTITANKYGVSANESIVTISGGIITTTSAEEPNYTAVISDGGAMTITGGEISGAVNDLWVLRTGSITLTLAEGATEGATFPGGLTVYNTTLDAILAEGAAYWQGTKMLTNIADDAITITGGDVTVKAECKHENVTYSGESNNATEHKIVCSECDNVLASEPHTRTYTASGNVITERCSKCKATFGTATITANDKTYNGKPVTAAVQKTGVLTGSNIGITYSQNGEELNESAIRAGTYTASIRLGDAVAKVNFTITPATLPNAVLSATGYTYNGQQQKPAVTVNGLTENTDYTVTYPQDVTNAGEKTVTITGKGNYTGTVTKSYSIAKADSIVTKAPQAAANLVYNGKNQNLVIAGTVTGGTLQYSLDGKTWAAKIPVGKAAGTYTVSYKVVGDANHKDIAVRTLAVTIAKGTAPAVDALVQTHFYAYATANTVDLAKYLPADRGTTAYTAIGISADIFSSVLSVTNAGVLSYTTRKLTAAPASDTQICIKVVMENYADAELTVTVKLLAVTEQTQQKIVKTELTEVPAGLAGTRFHSVDAIKTEQKRVLGLLLGYDPQGNIAHYDVKLQFSPDGGKTWVDATEENFPANGLTITLPYPSSTGKNTHNFVVSHMFTTGAKAGTIETPAVTKTADGIQFTVTGLSPVSVAWSAIPFDVNVANVTNGTVYVSSAQAAAGTQVTITATPKSGYRLSTLTVKDAAGNFCVVSTDNNGKYYFTMPAADVMVTATFTAKSTAVADTTNPKTGDDFQILFWSGMMMTTLLGAAALMLNKQKFYER